MRKPLPILPNCRFAALPELGDGVNCSNPNSPHKRPGQGYCGRDCKVFEKIDPDKPVVDPELLGLRMPFPRQEVARMPQTPEQVQKAREAAVEAAQSQIATYRQLWDEIHTAAYLDDFPVTARSVVAGVLARLPGPCHCRSNWTKEKDSIDFSTPESYARSIWRIHSAVNAKKVPPVPSPSFEEADAFWRGKAALI